MVTDERKSSPVESAAGGEVSRGGSSEIAKLSGRR
jgi:hypothetical protein